MANDDIRALRARLMRDARQFAEGGNKIVNRGEPVENTSLRAAANQFRQAAMALDQLDGLEQAVYHMKLK